ncbi:NAD(P)H-dependent oxidoreductase [Herbiconiux moechotypicola]|uniref:NAD(P)H-dependent oxidoreductase n=1 Tax=Herbiconiux moechotypicola TaxID=637393 RepID=A0ABN3DA57_9MICO|nr:NAD(P)H-dependent oxidoreductase [Herbiconiux moechotypicola]MCS5729060.1 NAD(P)H-dependent oxidoreductase [Herbiconiux moechotypicola]
MSEKNVLVLVGSLRAASTNRQLAEAAVELAPEGASFALYEGHHALPLYNEDVDVEGELPESVVAYRAAIAGADAVLVVTPEHNGTIPANLKNAIDWSSRPYGSSSISSKPVAVIGTAFAQYGGVWAQDEARKAYGIAGANVLDTTVLAVPNSVVRFAELHPKDDAEITEQLSAFIAEFVAKLDGAAAASEDSAAA